MSPNEYLETIKKAFSKAGDPLTAEGQMKYMRNKFSFYGLKAPSWVAILREIFAENALLEGEELKTFVRLCFEEEYREMHYAGLQMIEKQIRKQEMGFIDFLEECIRTQSWWDSVDWINKLVGMHLKRHRDMQEPYAYKWIEDGNFWLQRVAIIHQLTYKDDTDFTLMQRLILHRADSTEFFVQKACGWALRQYSKYNAEGVIGFVDEHEKELSSLTKREAMKWLKRQGGVE